jgi:hypothetical protein
MTVKGYKYNTEAEAKVAQTQCREHYGIPRYPTSTTTEWVMIEEVEDTENFWVIGWNDTLNVVLGEPSDIEIPEEPG